MLAFEVDDMTCGHCASTITKAISATDPKARVVIDLSRHLVTIESGAASARSLEGAIRVAGYTPIAVKVAAAVAPAASTTCCGHCH